jgi:ubiquinone/menaquinone biosynthesis C-methylase UbiE
MKKRKEFFENLAREWDNEHNTEEEIKRTQQFAARYFPVNGGETVLDVGCGTGRLIPQLETVIGKAGRLVELDFSREMLKIGKKRHRLNYRNLLFVQADGHRLPLKDRCIDTVVCMAFFPHLSDKVKGMEAFARVLKPGGRLYVAHQMNRIELNRLHGNIDGPVSEDLLPGKDRMRELFKQSGFVEINIREEPGLYLAEGRLGDGTECN